MQVAWGAVYGKFFLHIIRISFFVYVVESNKLQDLSMWHIVLYDAESLHSTNQKGVGEVQQGVSAE